MCFRDLPINIASAEEAEAIAPKTDASRVFCVHRRARPQVRRVPCAFAPLYVGQTAHSPEERFEQHKAGGMLAAAKPHRFGVRLRYDLMKGIGPFKTRYGSRSR